VYFRRYDCEQTNTHIDRQTRSAQYSAPLSVAEWLGRRSGVAVAMRHRLQRFIYIYELTTYEGKKDEHRTSCLKSCEHSENFCAATWEGVAPAPLPLSGYATDCGGSSSHDKPGGDSDRFRVTSACVRLSVCPSVTWLACHGRAGAELRPTAVPPLPLLLLLMLIIILSLRVVSVLDSGAEGPGLKSQPRRCPVTVLGKQFTPIVPLFTKQQEW